MSMVGFPLLLIPLAIYNIIVFLMPGVSLAEPLVTLPLMSGAQWQVDLSDVLLTLGILMLLLEVIKGARPGARYLTDHLLSLLIFGGAAAEFLLWPRFANSTYFLLLLLALTDFLSGVALRVRRTPAMVDASRSARRAAANVRQEDVRQEPDLHASAVAPASEPAWPTHSEPAHAEPAHSEPVHSEPAHAEPALDHPEPKAAANAEPETPPSPSQPGSSTPQPGEPSTH
jgi:hypothetical protein